MKNEKRKMLEMLKKVMMDEDDMGLPEALKDKKMKKVVVASDSKEGLQKGLNKAEEILKKRSQMLGLDEEDAEEEMEDEEMEMADGGCPKKYAGGGSVYEDGESSDDLKKKISKLQGMLK